MVGVKTCRAIRQSCDKAEILYTRILQYYFYLFSISFMVILNLQDFCVSVMMNLDFNLLNLLTKNNTLLIFNLGIFSTIGFLINCRKVTVLLLLRQPEITPSTLSFFSSSTHILYIMHLPGLGKTP